MNDLKPRDRLIFALDVNHIDEATRLVKLLKGHVGAFKIGLELFSAEGTDIFFYEDFISLPILLDLKLHDIPETVKRTVSVFKSLNIVGLTVHTAGGRRMLEWAASIGIPIYGVTVLTSLGDEDIRREGTMPLKELVRSRAELAAKAGCKGIIASAHETSSLQDLDIEIVTPGIRLPKGTLDDQKRVALPRAAIASGATRIVVGRTIRDAEDPTRAADFIVEEIRLGLQDRE